MTVRTCAAHSGRTCHGDLCGVFSNRAVDIFRCTLGMSCSREDGTVVLGEDVQPRSDVGCMILARVQIELEIRTQERSSKLSDQFLHGIAFAAEAMSTEVTIKPAGASSPVRAFVRKCRVVAIRIPEADERRHLDGVAGDAVVRAISAMTDDCTKRCEEPLRAFDPSNRIKLWDCFRIINRRQPIDLLNVKYSVTFNERDFARDLIAGLFIGLFASDRIGIDPQRSLLSFADVSVKLRGLLKGHPGRCREVLRDGAGPQSQHIDPAVRLPVVAERPRDSASCVFGVPGLDPRSHAALEMAHDLIRDSSVDVLLFDSLHTLFSFYERENNLIPS
jgi:hypothetical protein